MNSTVAILGPDTDPLQEPVTVLSFTKYLIEPESDEMDIDPYTSTLFLYAVATIDEEGGFTDNPGWVANYITLLESNATAESRSQIVRKRLRRPKEGWEE